MKKFLLVVEFKVYVLGLGDETSPYTFTPLPQGGDSAGVHPVHAHGEQGECGGGPAECPSTPQSLSWRGGGGHQERTATAATTGDAPHTYLELFLSNVHISQEPVNGTGDKKFSVEDTSLMFEGR